MKYSFEIFANHMMTYTPAHMASVEWILFASKIALENAVKAFFLVSSAFEELLFEGWGWAFSILCHLSCLEDCLKYHLYIIEADESKTYILCLFVFFVFN